MFGTLWVLLALRGTGLCAWMAPVVAFDTAVMLRLGGMRPGQVRIAWAMAATMLTAVLAIWSIIALQIGLPMGLGARESLTKLGFGHAWTLLMLVIRPADLAWMLAGLATALMLTWSRAKPLARLD